MNERKIINFEVSKLQKYPKQDTAAGYKTNADHLFIESVKTLGVLQPLIVSDWFINDNGQFQWHKFGLPRVSGLIEPHPEGSIVEDQRSFVIVSGHNRLEAAIQAGMETVPCEFKHYPSVEMMDLEYLETNRQRPKTKEEKRAEFEGYKQILCQITKYKEKKGVKIPFKNLKKADNDTLRTLSEGSENLDFSVMIDFLERVGIDINKNIDSAKALALATGLGEREIRNLNKVKDDDYMAAKQTRWEKFIKYDDFKKQIEEWYDVRDQFQKEIIDLKEAAKRVDSLIAKVENKISKLEGKKVKPADKPLIYISIPVTDNPEARDEAAFYESSLKTDYRVLNPIKIGDELEKSLGRTPEWIEFMEKELPRLAEASHYAPLGDAGMRYKSLGCRIEDTVALLLKKKTVTLEKSKDE